jgi:broad specificity phosphatase PhoE
VDPFPDGESYQQVAPRVSGWLDEALQNIDAGIVR